jgi:hypothetical protein
MKEPFADTVSAGPDSVSSRTRPVPARPVTDPLTVSAGVVFVGVEESGAVLASEASGVSPAIKSDAGGEGLDDEQPATARARGNAARQRAPQKTSNLPFSRLARLARPRLTARLTARLTVR